MKKIINPYIQLLILLCLVIIFTSLISFNQYPDYINLTERLKNNYEELNFTLQKHILTSVNNLYTNKDFKMSDFTNLTFFIPSFFVCVALISIGNFLDKKNKTNEHEEDNFFFITTLGFPSVLLAITAISSEAVYTIISIYVISKLNFNKGPFCLTITSIFLLTYCYCLDRGNFMVLGAFISGYIFLALIREFTTPIYFLLSSIIIIFFIITFGTDIFIFFGSIYEAEKIINVMGTINNLNLQNPSLFELIPRVIYFWVTLTSLNFGDKKFSYVAICFFLVVFFIFLQSIKNEKTRKNFKEYFSCKYNQLLYYWIFLYPILFIYILPTHAYAKYYLFYILIILRPLNLIFEKTYIYVFLGIFSFLSIFEKYLLL